MKAQRVRIERVRRALLEARLADTTDPLARARLKEALAVPLASWTEGELLALRAALPEAPRQRPPDEPLDLQQLSDEALRALKRQLEQRR